MKTFLTILNWILSIVAESPSTWLNREIEANYSLIPMMMKMTTSLFVMMECKNWPWFLTARPLVLWKNLTRQYLLKVKHFQEDRRLDARHSGKYFDFVQKMGQNCQMDPNRFKNEEKMTKKLNKIDEIIISYS